MRAGSEIGASEGRILPHVRTWGRAGPWRLLLVVLFLAVANIHANVRYRVGLLYHNFDGMAGVAVFVALWLLAGLGMLAISRIRGLIQRGVFLLAFFVFTFFGVAFEYSVGTQLNYENFAIAWEARALGGDAIGFYWSAIAVAFVVTAVGCVAISVSGAAPRPAGGDLVRSSTRRGLLGLPGVAVFTACLPFVAMGGLVFLRGGDGSDGLPIQYKAAALFATVVVNEALAESPERRHVDGEPVREGIRNIVLIVDESVRGDYASSPDLLPSLQRLSRYRHDFGIAVSATNCSAGSNLALRTGATQSEFQKTINENPYIWDYARRAGYQSVFIEAQVARGRLNNRMSLAEKARIDEFVWVEGGGAVLSRRGRGQIGPNVDRARGKAFRVRGQSRSPFPVRGLV